MATAHYRLTNDEFLHINSTLTNAQLRVYMYWKTLDPFGDRKVEICTKAIAETLGMAQRTVQMALNKLAAMNMIIWQKAKSFVTRSVDHLGDHRIAEAIYRSPERSQDRERQLELNLGADSGSPQSSSILFNLFQSIDQENSNFENSENLGNSEFAFKDNSENLEMSIEDIRALIDRSLFDEPEKNEPVENFDELDNATLIDEDTTEDPIFEDELRDQLDPDDENSQSDLDPKVEPDFVPEKPKTGVEVESFRRRVENFVLQTLNKSFPTEERRAAYFRKFDAKSWKKWEGDYREATKPQVAYKPFVPEKVEVAPPDSPVAQSAIAFIKAKLGIKS
jgi:hypothetical protein